jgi:hypothetical protein
LIAVGVEPASHTGAGVVIDAVSTGSAVEARAGGALVDIHCAGNARVASDAGTSVGVDMVCAVRVILASRCICVDLAVRHPQRGQTLIDIDGAVLIARAVLETSGASACIMIHTVRACRPIHTLSRGTLIDVSRTVEARVSSSASAGVRIDVVSAAGPVLARVGGTLVDIGNTVGPSPSRRTRAAVRIDVMRTTCPVLARCRYALIDISHTVGTGPTWLAVAPVLR